MSSLYCESTRRKTKKKTSAGGRPTILEQHIKTIAGTIPSSQISSYAILYMSSSTIVNITCGAYKNIVTDPIEVLPGKKLICTDCCLNLVCKKPDFIKCPGCDQNHATTCESFSQISPVVDNLLREILFCEMSETNQPPVRSRCRMSPT